MALTPKQTHQLLQSLGHTPKKALGQNFLIDPNIVQKQLNLANFKPTDTVIEVGPGLGTLTGALLSQGATVYAVELDARLAEYLRTQLQPHYPKFHLLEGDAVKHPLAGLPEDFKDSFHVIANLPYAISTPWLAEVLLKPHWPQRMTLMLQKEAAERFVSPATHKAFSPISIAIQLIYDKVALYNVSRQLFYPIPGVDSCLLCLQLKEHTQRLTPATYALIQRFFTQRRKQIGGLIKQELIIHPSLVKWAHYLESQGIPLTTRPEGVPLEAWKHLNETNA